MDEKENEKPVRVLPNDQSYTGYLETTPTYADKHHDYSTSSFPKSMNSNWVTMNPNETYNINLQTEESQDNEQLFSKSLQNLASQFKRKIVPKVYKSQIQNLQKFRLTRPTFNLEIQDQVFHSLNIETFAKSLVRRKVNFPLTKSRNSINRIIHNSSHTDYSGVADKEGISILSRFGVRPSTQVKISSSSASKIKANSQEFLSLKKHMSRNSQLESKRVRDSSLKLNDSSEIVYQTAKLKQQSRNSAVTQSDLISKLQKRLSRNLNKVDVAQEQRSSIDYISGIHQEETPINQDGNGTQFYKSDVNASTFDVFSTYQQVPLIPLSKVLPIRKRANNLSLTSNSALYNSQLRTANSSSTQDQVLSTFSSELTSIKNKKENMKYTAYMNKVSVLNGIKQYLESQHRSMSHKTKATIVVMIDRMERDIKFLVNNYDQFEYVK